MSNTIYQQLPGAIACVDAMYTGPGVACFYLVRGGDECALIETGTAHSVVHLRQCMRDLGLRASQLRYIVPTHVHLDHAGACGVLMREFPHAELLVHPRGARHLIDPTKLLASAVAVYGEAAVQSLYGEVPPVPAQRVRALEDGEGFSVGGREFTVRHTRGHAEHHFCVYDAATHGWFTGDMFGISYAYLRSNGGDFVLPATTPTQFDPEAYAHSVQGLAETQPALLYLTHYGALPFTPTLAGLLLAQLRDYVALGERCGVNTEALERGVLDITARHLAHSCPALSAGAVLPRLTMDVRLNAQGIAYRQQRLLGATSR